ncbi:MAG: helix-turn-helix transcriptional regulator [Pirellulales bacterium]
MRTKRTNPDFLNGVPELLMLRLLSQRPMHGYELVQALRQASGEVLDFGEGCVYPILHRLEANRLLKSHRDIVGGRSRLVYSVTVRGEKRLAESISLWKGITEAISSVLMGAKHGQVQVA